MNYFKAPWGKTLVVASVLASLLVVGIPLGVCMAHPPHIGPLPWLLVVLAPACALFTVRGYTIMPDAILVHRLLWATRLPRAGLQSATVEPRAMSKCIRTFGNGGFYSFTGFYWSKKLGPFRAYVTNLRLTVILRYAKRTVVVSPDNPEEFARALAPAS